MSQFDEVQFPTYIAFRSTGGPLRQSQVVTLGSGAERRNARWFASRRKYNVQVLRSDDDVQAVIEFFEARNAKLIGFRFKDWSDYKSCAPSGTPSSVDQQIGTGSGTLQSFQLTKLYASGPSSYLRNIIKPVAGSVLISFNNVQQSSGSFTVDTTTGLVTCSPGPGVIVKGGFEFDTAVRFDTDQLEIVFTDIGASQIQTLPIIELPP